MAGDSPIPITRNPVPAERAEAIRAAVRLATPITTENAQSRLATPDDAEMFFAFLSDPAISAPIYTLPQPLAPATVRLFIEKHCAEQARGEGLLFFNFNQTGELGGYTDLCIWPDWAAGELGGAVHPDRQGERRGVKGAELSFDWMFDTLDLDLICETAALDNIRTARLLDHLGFRRMGEVTSQRDDGTTRPSLVWEVTRAEWAARDPLE
jgi:RimJ/RimL family protein N-acetyltransferase